jgi:hypothetical protein
MNKKPVCQVGDLAIIIKSPLHPENIGKIVKVVREAVLNEIYTAIDGRKVAYKEQMQDLVWEIESEGSPLLLHTKEGVKLLVLKRAYADFCLFPIRDKQPAASSTNQREKETT